jgi:hypothetical protein
MLKGEVYSIAGVDAGYSYKTRRDVSRDCPSLLLYE